VLAMFAEGNGKTFLRGILFFIIIGTLPFYMMGFYVLANGGNSPSEAETTLTADATLTPLGADVSSTPTLTPSPTSNATATDIDPLQPTPFQFIPPTRIPTNTPTQIPTNTPVPTNTPLPTAVGDRDGDGVLDNVDSCPDTAGTQSN